MIVHKAAKVVATKSHYAKLMVNISVCNEQHGSYYKNTKNYQNM